MLLDREAVQQAQICDNNLVIQFCMTCSYLAATVPACYTPPTQHIQDNESGWLCGLARVR